jgi:hypothetical protein
MRTRAVLLPVLGVLFFAAPAAAAQHPKSIPHGAPPFGHSSKATCPKPGPGQATCLALIATTSPGGPAVVSNTPAGYGPVDLQTAYNLTSLSANNGTGRTVAIVDAFDDPNAESDLATYRSTFGLSPCTTANGCFKKVDQNGGTSYPRPNASWAVEISLDLDMVSAIAPNAHIVLVETKDNFFTNLGTGVNQAVAQGANIVSNSYASSGDAGASGLDVYYNHPGVAILASSGDNGWSNCDNACTGNTATGVGGANFPASDPNVTAVGGTSLNSTSPRSEQVWGDGEGLNRCYNGTTAVSCGAGSGCSASFAAPAWQSFFTSCGGARSVADISADADPNTGVAVYDSYGVTPGFYVAGGTSAASPIWGGVNALLDSSAWAPGFSYSHTSDYFDITTGTNGVLGGCSTNPPTEPQCDAQVGYDGPTGNGTPNGTLLPPGITSSKVGSGRSKSLSGGNSVYLPDDLGQPPVNVGDLVLVWVTVDQTSQPLTISDTGGNSWTQLVSSTSPADGGRVALFYTVATHPITQNAGYPTYSGGAITISGPTGTYEAVAERFTAAYGWLNPDQVLNAAWGSSCTTDQTGYCTQTSGTTGTLAQSDELAVGAYDVNGYPDRNHVTTPWTGTISGWGDTVGGHSIEMQWYETSSTAGVQAAITQAISGASSIYPVVTFKPATSPTIRLGQPHHTASTSRT